jgi:hypothetical protein
MLPFQRFFTELSNMDAQASALYAAHGEVGMVDESLNAQWSEFSAGQFERRMTFSVEGDLNKQECCEIRKVMNTINRMMHQFVQGKLNPMRDVAIPEVGFPGFRHLYPNCF